MSLKINKDDVKIESTDDIIADTPRTIEDKKFVESLANELQNNKEINEIFEKKEDDSNDNINNDNNKNSISYKQALTLKTLNPHVQKAKYAVRGAIVAKATQMSNDLKNGNIDTKKCGFKKIIFCNIGNPHAVGQIPLTYHRQVLACILCPMLMDDKIKIFPNDVKKRAKQMLSYTSNGSIGAYTHSMGMLQIRENVAKFIQNRDNVKSNANNIFLSAGASASIKLVFSCIITSKSDAVLVPIPQYPVKLSCVMN